MRIFRVIPKGIIIIASSSRIPEFLIRCNHDVCILPARIQSPRTMHSVIRRLHTHEHSPISISLSAQHLIPKRFPRATCKFPPISTTYHTIRVAQVHVCVSPLNFCNSGYSRYSSRASERAPRKRTNDGK